MIVQSLVKPMFVECAGTRLERKAIKEYVLQSESDSRIERESPGRILWIFGVEERAERIWEDGRKFAPGRPQQRSSYPQTCFIQVC
jgi:hypothetical protein